MAELRVKEILNQRGISVSEFAKMIGVTREHCYSLVGGKHASQKNIKKMASVLNLPIRDLYAVPAPVVSLYNPYDIVFGRTEHYHPNDIVTFGKLDGKWGAFSNMSTDYSVECCGYNFKTSEHLFIALRFSGYPKLQKEIMEYPNSMYCKKIFVNGEKYKPYHHPNWHDNYFDVEVMKYIVALKYAQNKDFRKLLSKTRGKVIVEDTTQQNSTNSVLRWGCQDLQKKDLVGAVRSTAKKYIHAIEKEAEVKTSALKKPRSIAAQQRADMKLKTQIQAMEEMAKLCQRTILEHCHYTLVGENAMGKILTILRDNDGIIDYKLEYPLYLFDNEIK
jgi:predicted NAD-dependent protein-ADP-ribosyltransferase YbiA (DUF1768 family)/DNA-binding XRE family transcriptional regulator